MQGKPVKQGKAGSKFNLETRDLSTFNGQGYLHLHNWCIRNVLYHFARLICMLVIRLSAAQWFLGEGPLGDSPGPASLPAGFSLVFGSSSSSTSASALTGGSMASSGVMATRLFAQHLSTISKQNSLILFLSGSFAAFYSGSRVSKKNWGTSGWDLSWNRKPCPACS